MTDQHEEQVGARSSTATTPAAAGGPLGEQILTIPNIISFARLLGVPVFLWLVLGVPTRRRVTGGRSGC